MTRWPIGAVGIRLSIRKQEAPTIVLSDRAVAIVGGPDVLEHLRNGRFGVFGHKPHKKFVRCIHGFLPAGGWRDAAKPGFAHLGDEHT